MLQTVLDIPRTPVDSASQTTGRISVTVVGIKPLLTHNPAAMAAPGGAKRGSRVPDAADEAEAGTYRLEDGTCALRGDAFRASILGAAGQWKVKGKQTMKGLLTHIIIVEELVPLTYPDGSPITSYEIDERRAIVQKNGILRRRPRFDTWAATYTVEYDRQLLHDPAAIIPVINDAGGRIGVGDYRPQRNGPFGRYQVRDYAILA